MNNNEKSSGSFCSFQNEIRSISKSTLLCHTNYYNPRKIRYDMDCSCAYMFWELGALIFYDLLSVHPRTVSQIIQLGAQFFLNIFISLSLLYMSRASKCPSLGENHCIYVTVVFVTLYGRRLVGWLDWILIQPADQTPPIQSDKYEACPESKDTSRVGR